MNASGAGNTMHAFVAPIVDILCVVGGVACTLFLVNGGVLYLTSAGKPNSLEHAKRVIRNALLGLVIIFAASALTQILTHAYGAISVAAHAAPPNLTAITPAPVSNGLVGVLIKAITGVLNDIVQSLALPFIKSLVFFTRSTPLMADNSTVFSLWLGMVGVSDALFTLVVALLGFHIMGASTFGFSEVGFKHLLPRLVLVFLALNTSIFAIDGVIELSNALLRAVNPASAIPLWSSLTGVVAKSPELGLPSLLIMMLFTIFSVVLVLYYLGRLITLYIGAVLSPLILLLWIIPGFREFSEAAAKSYITTVFVLFVQVVVLIIAGSLIAGTTTNAPFAANTLMPMVTGVAAMYAVLKVPVSLTHLSLVSIGPRSARQLGDQFINSVSTVRGGRRTPSFLYSQEGNDVNSSRSSRGSQNSGLEYKRPKSTGANVAPDSSTPKQLQSKTIARPRSVPEATRKSKTMGKS